MGSEDGGDNNDIKCSKFLGLLHVVTRGQNGSLLGSDEQEIAVFSLAILQIDENKVWKSLKVLILSLSAIYYKYESGTHWKTVFDLDVPHTQLEAAMIFCVYTLSHVNLQSYFKPLQPKF